MSRGVNKVILVGNLGQKPEIRYTKDSKPIASFSIATSESWKDKTTGDMVEKTEWHNVTFFGRIAEVAEQYLDKGSKVFVEGKLQTDKWEDENGNKRSAMRPKKVTLCHSVFSTISPVVLSFHDSEVAIENDAIVFESLVYLISGF